MSASDLGRDRLLRLASYPNLHQFNVDELLAAGIPYHGHIIDGTEGWDGSPLPAEGRRKGGKADMSPEAVEARALAKARHAEAIAYVASYTGSWGLPLDIRAKRSWGSKHLKLTEGQVDALLKGKARDAERLAAADPRQATLLDRIGTVLAGYPEEWTGSGDRRGVPDFVNSIAAQAAGGRVLSAKQIDAVERWIAGQAAPRAPQGRPSGIDVEPGWYLVGEQPWKVQFNREKTRRYAMRLVEASWEYVPGGLGIVAREGVLMTLEQAEAYGKLYGVCAICGTTLTDPKSIARGIGPICAGRLA